MSSACLTFATGQGISDEAVSVERKAGARDAREAAIYSRSLWDLEALIAETSHAGWDGFGAAPVTAESVARAHMLLESLPIGVPPAELSVDNAGDVWVEWSEGPHQVFSVAAGPGRVYSYAGLFGTSRVHGSEEMLDRIVEVVSIHLARLYPHRNPGPTRTLRRAR